MAALSDQLLVVAILGYLAAMMLSAAEYAFGSRSVVARSATRELVAVGAGAPAPVDHGQAARDNPDTPTARLSMINAGIVGAFVVAVAAHLGAAGARGVAAGRMPLGNMYEFVLSVTLVGSVAWLVVLWRRPALRHLGLYVAIVQLLLLGVAGMVLYTEVGPLVPALKSYWLVVHVTANALAAGVFLLGFVPATLHVIRSGYDRGKVTFPYSLGSRLPAADTLEPLTFRLHAFAFPIWTFGVAAGAIWAEVAWGRYWGWDPKETWAFISWIVYAGYLHARATPSMRRYAPWIAVIGWLTMLMNLFGVNLFFTGLHSYAGV